MKQVITLIGLLTAGWTWAADNHCFIGYIDPVTGRPVSLSPQSSGEACAPEPSILRPPNTGVNPRTGRVVNPIFDKGVYYETLRGGTDGNDNQIFDIPNSDRVASAKPATEVTLSKQPPKISGANKPGQISVLKTPEPVVVVKRAEPTTASTDECSLPFKYDVLGRKNCVSAPRSDRPRNGFLNRRNFSPSAGDLSQGPARTQISQSQINGQGVLLATTAVMQIIQAQTFAPQDQGELISGISTFNPLILIDYGRGLPRTAANIARNDTVTALNRADILNQTGRISDTSFRLSLETAPGLSERQKELIIKEKGLRPKDCRRTPFSEIYNQFK